MFGNPNQSNGNYSSAISIPVTFSNGITHTIDPTNLLQITGSTGCSLLPFVSAQSGGGIVLKNCLGNGTVRVKIPAGALADYSETLNNPQATSNVITISNPVPFTIVDNGGNNFTWTSQPGPSTASWAEMREGDYSWGPTDGDFFTIGNEAAMGPVDSGHAARAVLSFDISTIPNNAIIDEVEVSLNYYFDAGANTLASDTVALYKLDADFNPYGITIATAAFSTEFSAVPAKDVVLNDGVSVFGTGSTSLRDYARVQFGLNSPLNFLLKYKNHATWTGQFYRAASYLADPTQRPLITVKYHVP
jgi:hypothetical protein